MGKILRIKDDRGRWITVPALIGEKGERGEPGEPGRPGESGADGKDATIDGYNVLATDGETLVITNGVLSVNRAHSAEADNTLPITSAAVHTEIGNIDALLKTI